MLVFIFIHISSFCKYFILFVQFNIYNIILYSNYIYISRNIITLIILIQLYLRFRVIYVRVWWSSGMWLILDPSIVRSSPADAIIRSDSRFHPGVYKWVPVKTVSQPVIVKPLTPFSACIILAS